MSAVQTSSVSRFATRATLGYRWWFSRHQSHAVRNLLWSTGVMEMNRLISISTELCSLASGSADARNWLRQASSTDDESGCASSTRWLMFRRWSRLLFGLAINECQISTLGLSLLVHTPAIPANVCPPGWSVGPPRSVWAVGCLLMSALMSRRRCARLHDETRLEIQASFRSHDLSMRAVCLLHSPSQITADYYHTRYRLRYVYRYIVFADTPVQWMNTHRYTISV